MNNAPIAGPDEHNLPGLDAKYAIFAMPSGGIGHLPVAAFVDDASGLQSSAQWTI
jgi:hypothetical protein